MINLREAAERAVEESYFTNDGILHSPKKSTGEFKNRSGVGELGELGENPHETSFYDGRKTGEKGRNSPRDVYECPIYPIEALDSLADVCAYMRDEMQLPVETAGQSLLAAASLLTQGLYDVETLTGPKPLSLYLLTLSDSGDGKSSADGVAMSRVSVADANDHAAYSKALARWQGLSKREREETTQPTAPHRTMGSGTIQGIVRSFKEGVPSQGSFTAEAATMLSGWGVSHEQKKDTLAGLNALWDGSPISIVRQGEGRTQLYDKRFCCHWLIQPDAARESLNDDLFRTIGLWPRFLVAWPSPLKPREYRKYAPHENESVLTFWRRCDTLLSERYSIPKDSRKVILLSGKAREVLIKFWERMELSRDPGNPLHSLKSFCVRGAEQVCRIAGVLAAFSEHSQGRVDFTVNDIHILNAIKLYGHNLETWQGIFGRREELENQTWANELYSWIAKQPDGMASEVAMLKLATPKHLRSRHKRDTALSILQAEGRVKRAVEMLPNGSQRVLNNEWVASNV